MEDYIRKKDIEILNGYKILAKLSGMNGWQGCCPKMPIYISKWKSSLSFWSNSESPSSNGHISKILF